VVTEQNCVVASLIEARHDGGHLVVLDRKTELADVDSSLAEPRSHVSALHPLSRFTTRPGWCRRATTSSFGRSGRWSDSGATLWTRPNVSGTDQFSAGDIPDARLLFPRADNLAADQTPAAAAEYITALGDLDRFAAGPGLSRRDPT
jgi:hypothetical protein